MNNLVLPHQDFFIYIPSQPHAKQPSPVAAQPASAHDLGLPPRYTDWIKIPLAESLVVYARMLDEQVQVEKPLPPRLTCLR